MSSLGIEGLSFRLERNTLDRLRNMDLRPSSLGQLSSRNSLKGLRVRAKQKPRVAIGSRKLLGLGLRGRRSAVGGSSRWNARSPLCLSISVNLLIRQKPFGLLISLYSSELESSRAHDYCTRLNPNSSYTPGKEKLEIAILILIPDIARRGVLSPGWQVNSKSIGF